MDLRLDRPLPKVTDESERSVPPAETVERATEALRRIGIDPRLETWDRDGFVWLADLVGEFRDALPGVGRGMRVSGKGPSEDQAKASCLMELVERASLVRYHEDGRPDHECAEIATGQVLRTGIRVDTADTICVAAGNNLEEAILHALHELVETRLGRSCLWKPFKVIDFDDLDLDFPGWVRRSYVAVRTPSDIEELFHATVIRFPSDGALDVGAGERFIKAGGWLMPGGGGRPPNHHTPHSGGAAGLNPASCVFRGIGEVLQGDRHARDGGVRRSLDGEIGICAPGELENRETDTITGDISKLLGLLGGGVFVGAIDLTDPEIGIPVIKLVSDWDPHRSLVSRDYLEKLFEEVP